jgi:hypothetical protein
MGCVQRLQCVEIRASAARIAYAFEITANVHGACASGTICCYLPACTSVQIPIRMKPTPAA